MKKMAMTTMMTSGREKQDNTCFPSLDILFEVQKMFQFRVTTEVLPKDDPVWFSYHMQAMLEELGEVLKADKRWKTHRNERYEKDEKLRELADVFITAINLALYSGFDAHDIHKAVLNKIQENSIRLKIEEVKNNADSNSGRC